MLCQKPSVSSCQSQNLPSTASLCHGVGARGRSLYLWTSGLPPVPNLAGRHVAREPGKCSLQTTSPSNAEPAEKGSYEAETISKQHRKQNILRSIIKLELEGHQDNSTSSRKIKMEMLFIPVHFLVL